MLCEIKLYIPSKVQEVNEEDEEKDEKEEKSENSKDKDTFSVEFLKSKINKITSSSANLGDTIALLTEIQMLTPRGKINVHFLKNTLKLTGSSYDYKISYNNINKAFLLPRQDGDNLSFVIGLKNAMRQGSTSYPFLIFQFKKGTINNIKINLPEDEKLKSQLVKADMQENLEGECYDIMAKLFKAVIGIGVIIPGKFKR